jgi:hypothetical protein
LQLAAAHLVAVRRRTAGGRRSVIDA